MQAALTIAGLWIAFAVTHMGLASLSLRPRLVARLGEKGYAAVYSVVALAIFVPMVSVYFANQHAGPGLWYLGHLAPVRALVYVGMALALALVVGGLLQPSPASMTGGRGEPRVRGMLRVTRHPLFMGFGVFGLVHLFAANLNAAELAFFAGFPIFAVIGCRHQDQRKLATQGERYRAFHAQTALLPFGRGGLVPALREAWLPVLIGLALLVGLRAVHARWFGGAPGWL